MIKVVKSALSYSAITKIFELYHNSTNLVKLEQDDNVVDRHTIGLIGKFLLSKFSREEFAFVWDEIMPVMKHHLNQHVDLVYARVLKYNHGCAIPKHLDAYAKGNQEPSDISVIIQITDPAAYTGGAMIVSGQLIELDLGDMISYTYDVEHEITPIKNGIRYVINLRCKMVK